VTVSFLLMNFQQAHVKQEVSEVVRTVCQSEKVCSFAALKVFRSNVVCVVLSPWHQRTAKLQVRNNS